MNVIEATDAAMLVEDGDTITVSGLAGNLVPEHVLDALSSGASSTPAHRAA